MLRFTDAQPFSTNTFGERKTGIELQAPTSFTGTGNIYANWANAWCDPATGEFTTDSTDALATNANRVWDLGGATQFPVLTCFGNEFNPSRQRYAITKVLNGESPLPLAPDTDGDGLFGSEDPMPNSTPADVAQGDPDRDGLFGSEDPDDDNDNHLDLADNCPKNANPSQANADGTGTEAGNACDDTFDGVDGQAQGLTALAGASNNVTLSWNNPTATAAEGLEITGIFLSRAEAGSSATRIQIAGGSAPSLGAQSVSLALGAGNTYEMSGLAPDTAYEFSLQLEYQDIESSNSITGEATPSVSVTTLVADTDGDGVKDDRDNCLNTPNFDQKNSDGEDDGGDACDDNDDNDNHLDATDVDDDGDGLIEIATAEEFNAIRFNLVGTNLTRTANDVGDATGCGGLNGISSCNGYELAADISLGGYSDWDPIGTCGFSYSSCDSTFGGAKLFAAILEGNGYSISDVRINATSPTSVGFQQSGANGIGLFGAVNGSASFQNLELRDINITSESGIGYYSSRQYLGSLVGFGINGRFSHVSVEDLYINVSNFSRVGGLLGGYEQGPEISAVSVSADAIISAGYSGDSVGGLVGGSSSGGGYYGSSRGLSISLSSVAADIIHGGGISGDVGGLVGGSIYSTSSEVSISSSSVEAGTISSSGGRGVGGLVGSASSTVINSSSVSVADISAASTAGGLVGNGGNNLRISSSLAVVGEIKTPDNYYGGGSFAGLVAEAYSGVINSSLALVGYINSDYGQAGGLVGGSSRPSVIKSYWLDSIKFVGVQSGGGTGLPGGIQPGSDTNTLGEGKSQSELQSPVSFTPGIYEDWAGSWCDPATGALMTSGRAPNTNYIQAWNLGNSTQYPVLNCFGEARSPAAQRQSIIDVLDPDRDGLFGGADPVPHSDPDDLALGDPDEDGYFGNEDPVPNSDAADLDLGDGDGDGYFGSEDPVPNSSHFDVALGDEDGDRRFGSEDPNPNTNPVDITAGDDDGDGYFGREDAFPNNATEHTDTDGDTIGNNIDIDDDGDGLIEVASADDLNKIRNNLAGTGLSNTPGTTGDKTGCPTEVNPGTDADGNSITACNGYELTTYIPLAHVGYTNWVPIGGCVAVNDCPNSFNGTFDGNGHSISELQISLSADAYGVGLFGAVNADASLRNLTLRDVDISSSAGGRYFGSLVGHGRGAEFHSILVDNANISVGATSVGGLVGYGVSADISSSLVVADAVSGYFSVGGLVGSGGNVDISSSSVVADTVRGSSSVGGLVGSGENVDISSSSALAGTVSGGRNVGGLVGWGRYADITSSSVVADTVSGSRDVGGLVGYGWIAVISSSSVVADTVSGDDYVGGLVGWGRYADITSSSVVAGTVSGDDYVGGLVGNGADADISSSLVLGGFINGRSHVGGLVGTGRPNSIADTYWLDSVQFTRAQPLSSNTFGEGKSASDLQAPVSFSGTGNIYANWANAWCDPATGEFTSNSTDDLATNAYRVWDLGSSTQFPVLSCFGNRLTEAAQRQKITEILDPDGDGLLGGADPVPNSDPADIALEDKDGDGYFGSEDAFPSAPDEWVDSDGDGAGDNSDPVPNSDAADVDLGDPDGDRYFGSEDPVRNSDSADIDLGDDDGDRYFGSEDPVPNSDSTDVSAGDPDGDRRFGSEDAFPNDRTEWADTDRDRIGNNADVDDDNDGLIEIATADDLNKIRNNLVGTGLSNTAGATGDKTGCPSSQNSGTDADGNSITACNGYELSADIDLLAAGYTNWKPIGDCTVLSHNNPPGTVCPNTFRVTFEGNGHEINSLRINITSDTYGVGLFAVAFGRSANLRNIKLRDVEITSNASGSSFGGLIGYGQAAILNNISVEDISINAPGVAYVGGLAGFAARVDIVSSSVIADTINGDSYVGGLVGYGLYINPFTYDASIDSSYVVVNTVSGGDYVGGLLGYGTYYNPFSWHDFDISSSFVVAGTIKGSSYVGGLTGSGEAKVSSSLVVVNAISGDDYVGGGSGGFAQISASLILGGTINGLSRVGGVAAVAIQQSITDSYQLNSVQFTGIQPTNNYGESKSAGELQSPVSFAGAGNIYANWANAWCNPATGEFTTDSTNELAIAGGGDTYRAWDLGNSREFPLLTCFGDKIPPAMIQHSAISKVLNGESPMSLLYDGDEDGLFGGEDPMPNSDPADVEQGDIDGDGYFGSEDPMPNSDPADVDQGDIDGDGFFGSEDPDDDNDNRLDAADNCPLVPNNDQANSDSDSYGNACDVDDDGDGLIEIATADELNNIRYNLEGAGLSNTAGATGDTTVMPDRKQQRHRCRCPYNRGPATAMNSLQI